MFEMPPNPKAYINYIKNLLKVSNYDRYVDELVRSVERNNYKITPRQYDVFEKYRRGMKQENLLREYIRKFLLEVDLSAHFIERENVRANLIDIVLPRDAYGNVNFKEQDLIKDYIINNIKSSLKSKIKQFKPIKFSNPSNVIVVYKALYPRLKLLNGQVIDIEILVPNLDPEASSNIIRGNGFYFIVTNNIALSLILSPLFDNNNKIRDKVLFSKFTKNNSNAVIKIIDAPLYQEIYDMKSIHKNLNIFKDVSQFTTAISKPSSSKIPSTLPYDVKSSYPVGSMFRYKGKGEGEILRTSNGRQGEGDALGKLQWIEVDFSKGVSRIPNVLTTKHFL